MTEWHCYVDGQQYGPISEDELREWMASGRVKPTDMVWTEGMADWQPAGGIDREQLTAEYPAASGQPQAEPEPPLLDALPGGTGGQAAVGELFSRGLSIVLQSLPLLLVAAFVAYIISSLPSIFETVADYAFEWQPTEQERLLLSLVQLACLPSP
ncbi:MAG: DUF4339 domain-containing protein, partial [Phycisphaerae bacterium]|nr:DUF4339 domain-containing protein [Phycisphaerae bacterium]